MVTQVDDRVPAHPFARRPMHRYTLGWSECSATIASMATRELPALITEFYRRCVSDPPAAPRGTLLEQRGEMRLGEERPWMPFTAEQSCQAARTGFVWHARFKMAPLVTGVVDDAYEDGHGRLDAKIWGVLPVAHGRGLEIDRGEAQRYLSELAWCPMALVHNPALHYRQLRDDAVRVWVHDEQTYVDLLFDAAGDIAGATTDTRCRGEQPQPWGGQFGDYRDFGDVRAPATAQAYWDTPQGRFTYWRGEVTSLRWAD